MVFWIALVSVVSLACDEGVGLVTAVPRTGRLDVPLDAHVVLTFDALYRLDGADQLPFLVEEGTPGYLPITRRTWAARDETGALRQFVELLPAAPLNPERFYAVYLADWATANAEAWTVPATRFMACCEMSVPPEHPPKVRLAEVIDRAAATECELGDVREFVIDIDPRAVDPAGVGLLHMMGVSPRNTGRLSDPDFTVAVPWDEGPQRIHLPYDAASAPLCVAVVRHDASGVWSPTSLPACIEDEAPDTDTGEPIVEPERPITEGGAGCSTAPGGGFAGLAALLLLVRRRISR